MKNHLNCLFFNTRYNLHSVTSNAVATQTVRTDLLVDPDFNTLINFGIWQIALTGSIPITDLHAPVLSAGTLYVGLPIGGENITQIFIQDYDNWMAFRHINTRLGFYENWVSTKIERSTITNPLTSSNLTINFSQAEIRNGICYLYARFLGTGTLTDGMIIANLNSYLRPVNQVGFTVYNSRTNKNYYVALNTDGNLQLWWNENANVNYDFFVCVTYVLY